MVSINHIRIPLLLGAMAFPVLASCDDDEDDTLSASDDGSDAGDGGASVGGSTGKGGSSTGGTGKAGSSTGGTGKGGSSTGGTGTGGATGDAGDDAGGEAGDGGSGKGGSAGGGMSGMGGMSGSGQFDGQEVFRFDTFGDEQLWTDQYRLHEAIQAALHPTMALSLGLKVDAEAVPAGVLATADLMSPATTVALIGLDAVVGVKGTVENGVLVRVGITCALCHSDVDDSVMPGIGVRIDGAANRDLNPGAIIALSPGLANAVDTLAVLNSLGPGQIRPTLEPRRHQPSRGDSSDLRAPGSSARDLHG